MIVVSLPVEEEESSLWDFDVASDKPSDDNTEKDSSVQQEGVTLSNDEMTTPQNVPSPRSSIWDVLSSENNISPPPAGSRFAVSRNSDDLESTRDSKPRSSRFTVSPS
jgi:hypothetical protein